MGTALGIGLPGAYPVQSTPWGPFGAQGIGSHPSIGQSYVQPFTQILQSLQHTPYQLQQLLQLAHIQQQQLQQLVQLVPAQLQQLQQLLQLATQQLQQMQYQSGHQFGQAIPGFPGSIPFGAPFTQPPVNIPFNPTHVM